jgi:predicted phage terminase large subunit-like protein
MFEDLDGRLYDGSIKLMGTGGTITGQNVDILICDDLVKGFSDVTPTLLDKKIEWFKSIILQRLEPHSKLIILGTRWASNDVIGYLQENQPNDYKFINLTALNEDESDCIWNNRYNVKFFQDRRKEIGERLFEALYQQKPLDMTGSFFNLDKVMFSKYQGPLGNSKGTVRSWDFAYSNEEKGEVNDYTAGIKMTRTVDDMYLVHDLVYGQFGEDLIHTVKSTARLDTPNIPILLETGTKGGASKFLFDSYKQMYLKGFRVQQSEPLGSKVDRAAPFRDAILDGKVIIDLPDNEREQVIRQLQSFPLHKRDDIIDAMSYAYNFLSQGSGEDNIATANKRTRRSL